MNVFSVSTCDHCEISPTSFPLDKACHVHLILFVFCCICSQGNEYWMWSDTILITTNLFWVINHNKCWIWACLHDGLCLCWGVTFFKCVCVPDFWSPRKPFGEWHSVRGRVRYRRGHDLITLQRKRFCLKRILIIITFFLFLPGVFCLEGILLVKGLQILLLY